MFKIIIKFFIIIFLFASSFSISAKDSLIISIENPAEYCKPKIALVLSGGGARGISQIGAINEFANNDIHFDYVVGTSIGAIVGGLISIGYSPLELDSIIKHTDWGDLFSLKSDQNRSDLFLDQKIVSDRSLLTLRFDNFNFVIPEAISVGTKLFSFIQKLVWNSAYNFQTDFDSLKYPFRAVATDLAQGKTISLSKGNLVTSIRSSATVPLRYSPVWLDSMVLVDGGLMANIPTEQALEFKPDLIFTINTISPLLPIEELNKPWNLADQVVSIQMEKFSTQAKSLADVIIEPDLKYRSNLDFAHLDTLIELGATATKIKINEINELINLKKKEHCLKFLEELKRTFNYFPQIKFIGLLNEDSISILNKYYSFEDLLLNLLSLKNINYYKSIQFIKNENSELKIVLKRYDIIKEINIFDENNEYENVLKVELNEKFINQSFNKITEKEVNIFILKELRKRGFTFASTKRILYNKFDSSLNIHLDYGKVHSIKVSGNKSAKDILILRDLKFEKGDYLNSQKIATSWDNLMYNGLFEKVEFEVNKSETNDGVDVSVFVKENPEQTISLGARVDNERYTQVGLDFIQNNIFNYGAKFNARFSAGSRNQYASLSVIQPRILNSMITFSIKSYYEQKKSYNYIFKPDTRKNEFIRLQDGEYSVERYGFWASFGTQIERKGTLSIDLRLEKQRSFDLNGLETKPAFYSVNTIKIGTIFDTEDKSEFPNEGRIINLSLETNLFNAANSIAFSKVEFYFSNIFSFNKQIIKPSVLFGFADETLPVPESFTFGGQDNFFGYKEDDGIGRQIFISSLEYRLLLPFSILFDTYVSFRYDFGSIWKQFEAIKLSSLKHGVGATLAIDSPVGPAKFSVGKGFNFLKDPVTVVWGETLIYFSLGIKL
ncbi:MAG TPA: patatin-like phospholipase family protein [Candidatus Kapabacteria bacterium]|nr:patatin-like phospholipase family protein [Candidatus Kapabacteria bacterium]HPO63554.1 patatin-like phospholipase family protein [Candidatus Kapabacteria bacterium]